MNGLSKKDKAYNAVIRRAVSVACILLCVPGMGMILWGVSPLYIIQKDILYENLKKY